MRKILSALLIGAVCAGGLIACGGDDNNGTTVIPVGDGGPTSDAPVTTMNNPDGNMMNNPDGNMGMTDGGSGCAFTDFVLNQAMNPQNQAAAAPFSMIPDPTCANAGPATQFSTLFP